MRRAHYLTRTRHGTWVFRIRVPRALVERIGCIEIRRSLQTTDVKIAQQKGRLLSIYAYALFDKLRDPVQSLLPATLGPMPLPPIFGFEINIQQGKVTVKTDPTKPGDNEAALEALRILNPVRPPIDVDEEMRRLGIEPEGNVVAAAPQLTRNTDTRPKLSEGLATFKERDKTGRSEKTMYEYELIIRRFINLVGDLTMEDVTERTLADYSHTLRTTKKNSEVTIAKNLRALNVLFKSATTQGLIKKNSLAFGDYANAKGQHRAQRRQPGEDRRAFTDEELGKLFCRAVFDQHMKRPDHHWIPLLGLFTGCRLNELCQMLTKDVVLEPLPHLNITIEEGPRTSEASQKTLKSMSAVRKVPLHPILLDLGFIDYFALRKSIGACAESAPDLLFPDLTHTQKNGYGGGTSKWFGRLLTTIGLTDPKLVFHSFRRNFNMRLKAAAVHQEDRAPLMGHRVGHVNNEHYLDQQITLQEAARLISLLSFEHIDFSELKRPPADYQRMLRASKVRLTKVARHEQATVKRKTRSVGHDGKPPVRSQSSRPKRNKSTT